MCVVTTQLNTYLKMHAKKSSCTQKIDDIAINARRTCVHTKHYSAAVCIMLYTKNVRAFWFAQTALIHFGLHKHECLIGV